MLAVNVILVPEQTLLADAAMLIVGTTTGFTVMLKALLVAVVGLAHVALEVITQVTVFPLATIV